MLVGYEMSDSDDEEEDVVTKEQDKQTLEQGTDGEQDNKIVKNDAAESFRNKFEDLKQRRAELKEKHSYPCIDSQIGNSCESSKSKKMRRGKRKKTSNHQFDELNSFMPSTFKVTSDNDPYGLKKSKLERELDEAVECKDFKLSEDLNNEMMKRNFATQVKGAIDAREFAKMREEIEKKKMKKKKLNWMFNHKQRWETKGNM